VQIHGSGDGLTAAGQTRVYPPRLWWMQPFGMIREGYCLNEIGTSRPSTSQAPGRQEQMVLYEPVSLVF
jgi:hypothetical protein